MDKKDKIIEGLSKSNEIYCKNLNILFDVFDDMDASSFKLLFGKVFASNIKNRKEYLEYYETK